ncbi:MAG: complex I 51 kDa subunit family protein [Candidatus Izemoplasmataceae bacterium]
MKEHKLLTKRFGEIDPFSIEDFVNVGGYETLKKAMKMTSEEIIYEVEASRITGRGGANFPTYMKMRAMAKETGDKYLVCNADEGEPGNFKDKHLMEKDPHQLIEGMLISAYAVGANRGYVYIRGEYQSAVYLLEHAINEARKHGYLGQDICGKDFHFDLEVRQGAGAYVCGEEFALLESIEGKPGRTRVKPPFPTEAGLFMKPTLINNVETFSTLPHIIEMSGEEYGKLGSSFASGTKLISLSGNVKHKGLYEVEYGTTIRQVIEELGGGVSNGQKINMVQLGGACGPIIPEHLLDMDIDNERFEIFNSKMGAGAIIVIDDRFDLFEILLRTMTFFAHESCGKCAPCREGHIQIVKLLQKFYDTKVTYKDYESLVSLANVIHETALCGLGQTSTTSILATVEFFQYYYQQRIRQSERREWAL